MAPRFFIGTALVLLALAALLNQWTFEILFSPGKPLHVSHKILVWLLQAALVLGAGYFLARRHTLTRKRFFFGLVIALLMVAAAEAALHGIHRLLGPRMVGEMVERLPYLPQYEDEEWAHTWAREYLETHHTYEPFVGWSIDEFYGETINVDADGTRRTWNPPDVASSADTLLVFGGSTVWGYGARDDHTIPSHLSRILHDLGYSVVVVNRGNLGFGFTQEVIQLTLLLREGHRPGFVLFYDGANDVVTAHLNGEPQGMLLATDIREKLDNASQGALQHFGSGMAILVEKSMIWRALEKARRSLAGGPNDFVPRDAEDQARLAREVVDYYGQTFALLENLSRIYGFRYLCFWQPVAFTEKELLANEKGTDPRLKDESLADLHHRVNAALSHRNLPHFHDVSDALADRTQATYIDYCHLTEEGNETVARRLARIFEEEYGFPR